METITRAEVLQELEIKETATQKLKVFAISFYKKDGELVFLPRAASCGLAMNMHKHRMRGIIAIDTEGNRYGHVYPVCIDNIREFNAKQVKI
jgi:predicted metal-dependent enzyme (double-stranded beta helix superfamily)